MSYNYSNILSMTFIKNGSITGFMEYKPNIDVMSSNIIKKL